MWAKDKRTLPRVVKATRNAPTWSLKSLCTELEILTHRLGRQGIAESIEAAAGNQIVLLGGLRFA